MAFVEKNYDDLAVMHSNKFKRKQKDTYTAWMNLKKGMINYGGTPDANDYVVFDADVDTKLDLEKKDVYRELKNHQAVPATDERRGYQRCLFSSVLDRGAMINGQMNFIPRKTINFFYADVPVDLLKEVENSRLIKAAAR